MLRWYRMRATTTGEAASEHLILPARSVNTLRKAKNGLEFVLAIITGGKCDLLTSFRSIDISRSEHNKSIFEVESDQGELILIDTEEREKLELALLAQDGIDVEDIIE